MATTFRQRKTPGTYITELNAFPPSVVGVETAIPGFIGYTEKAEVDGKPVYFKPLPIASLADYEAIFGQGVNQAYDVVEVEPPANLAEDPDFYDFLVESEDPAETSYYNLVLTNSEFNLYDSLKLFFANGGGNCFVVSVGSYYPQDGGDGDTVEVSLSQLQDGLTAMGEQSGPTMTVIPDAVLLPEDEVPEPNPGFPISADYATLVQTVLRQCVDLQDRVGIFDPYGAQVLKQDNLSTLLDPLLTKFREDVGSEGLDYGMAYFPPLNTSVVELGDIDYTFLHIEDATQLQLIQGILTTVAAQLYVGPQLAQVEGYINQMNPEDGVDPDDPQAVAILDNNLTNALPLLRQIEILISSKVNVLPPSGAMAGVFTRIDQTRGVWNAPANTSLTSVVSPIVNLTDPQQGNLNVPLDGKAVDAIRQFPGRGTVVWGARTLDGNSQDWRYIQVRRTIMYIEQSIKNALDPFVFAANDGNTWSTVVSMASNFLQNLWSQGGLFGATASEAFSVECGLGSTMTAQDVLDGYMVVQITLQMIRPAEFIELTFKQKMEGA
ncbi:MAG: phage tail sheath C-terminal domain-containing protein [Acidobacteriota bacterium]